MDEQKDRTTNMNSVRMSRAAISLLFGVAIFLFWLLAFPQALGYHEQYQMFLFTGGYLAERLSVAGGLASWLGECIVQFFVLPWLGALLMALLFVALQQSGRIIRPGEGETWTAFLSSFLVPILILIALGDSEMLPTYVVALILALACRRFPSRLLLALFPLFWWTLGPLAWVMVPQTVVSLPSGKKTLHIVAALLWCMASQTLLTCLFLRQYPLQEIWMGISYYRIPTYVPALQWIIALVAAVLSFVQRLKLPRLGNGLFALLLLAGCALGISLSYDRGTWRQIRCDQLVRQNRWDDLLALYEGRRPNDDYTCECLNLALAMKGELSNRMFFTGEGGTMAVARPYENNSFSLLPSAEVFFRCGMINEALRYYYDTQEAIMNCRKSSRCTQRMVECYLVDGRYDVARKHLERLKHTLFYRRWAKEMELFCQGDEMVESHPVYSRLRQMRSERDFLFTYDELYKMFGLLYLHDKSNTLALQYYVANSRLLGLQP